MFHAYNSNLEYKFCFYQKPSIFFVNSLFLKICKTGGKKDTFVIVFMTCLISNKTSTCFVNVGILCPSLCLMFLTFAFLQKCRLTHVLNLFSEDMPGAPEMLGYHPRNEDRTALGIIRDAGPINPSYDPYLRNGVFSLFVLCSVEIFFIT